MSADLNSNSDTRNITIRGVDLEVYEAFTSKLREYNMNIGEAFNKMIQDVLENFDAIFNQSSNYDYYEQQRRLPRLSIESHQELVINVKDLEETKSRISFRNIDSLSFDETVTKESFLKHVKDIRRCSMVKFSTSFPKLIALAYCEDCDNVEFD